MQVYEGLNEKQNQDIFLKKLDKASMFGKALEFLAKNTMLPSDAKKQDPIFTKR